MKSKISFIVIIITLFITGKSYADERHFYEINNGKFYLDEKYCFSIGDSKDEIIKSFGNPESMDDYAYYYKENDMCFELTGDNKIKYFNFYFPFHSDALNAKKIVIDNLVLDANSTLESTVTQMKEKNISYKIEQFGNIYRLDINLKINDIPHTLHITFWTENNTEYIYDFLY